MNNVKIAAIVVTYNRKELLANCLNALLAQTYTVDKIIIIDNASSDGTQLFLASNQYLTKLVIDYHFQEQNIGAAAGIALGMEIAYKGGADFLWVMDDDAVPEETALESLVRSRTEDLVHVERLCLYSCYLEPQGRYFSEPVVIRSDGGYRNVSSFSQLGQGKLHEGLGGPFLGFLIPRAAIEQVGLPDGRTFIWGDSEYFLRLRQCGYKIFYDAQSIIFHPRQTFVSVNIPVGFFKLKLPIWTKFNIPKGPPFKCYYGVRNALILVGNGDQSNINKFISKITLGILWTSLALIASSNKIRTLECVLWGIWDGMYNKMPRRFMPKNG